MSHKLTLSPLLTLLLDYIKGYQSNALIARQRDILLMPLIF